MLRDYLIIRALELSVELDVPMQFHTGVGDYDIVMDQCDPALMYDVLKDEQLRHATVVLVHSGFPNNQNAAWIVSLLPNVFLDFSLTVPFLNPVGTERLKEILQIAPSFKVMYGSDGFNLPELYWLGAKVGKNALSRCLSQLCEDGLFAEDTAHSIARRILFENANELYRLNLT
jgi:predicted TIM-barrel fold metal-dependent hydrolase